MSRTDFSKLEAEFSDSAEIKITPKQSTETIHEVSKPRPQTWYEWLFCIPATGFVTVNEVRVHPAGTDPLHSIMEERFTEKLRREYPYNKIE